MFTRAGSFWFVSVIMFVLATGVTIHNAAAQPVISNISLSQRTDGTALIDINYDLAGGVGAITVAVIISPDNGATWNVTPQAQYLAGDVGPVTNGTGKHIVWDLKADRPGICWPQMRARLIVTDETPGEGEPVEGEGEGEGEELTVTLPGDVPLTLVRIPAGTFMMGRYSGEQDSFGYEDPQHSVTLSQDFYLGKYELTKRQWQAVMDTTPWLGMSYVLDDLDSPAVYVSWNDAQSFITALNTHITNTGQGTATFRLPSEAEWEYACRAGTTTRFYWGDDPSYTQIGDYAWYRANAWDVGEQYAHVVGLKLPNVFGLYDMSGNVWEWCEDDWHDDYTGAPADGSAWVDVPRGSYRLLRGGSWDFADDSCRSASRSYGDLYPDTAYYCYGFRVARTP